VDAVRRFDTRTTPILSSVCRAHAERFSIERFRDEFEVYVNTRWAQFKASMVQSA
jgi:hypothetical protein